MTPLQYAIFMNKQIIDGKIKRELGLRILARTLWLWSELGYQIIHHPGHDIPEQEKHIRGKIGPISFELKNYKYLEDEKPKL